MSEVERYEYKGHTIVVEIDPDPMNPRVDFDNAGKMVCWHSRYNLGDEQPKETASEYRRSLAMEHDDDLERRIDWWENEGGDQHSWEFCEEKVREIIAESLEKHLIMLPCYLYDHSGITMNTSGFSCNWDSGQVGFIYISRKDAVKEWGKVRCTKKVVERTIKYLEGEVETYDQYLTGQVYGRRILKPATQAMIEAIGDLRDVDDDDREGLGSCWGFFGMDMSDEDSYMVEEAKGEIDYEVERLQKELSEQVVNEVLAENAS